MTGKFRVWDGVRMWYSEAQSDDGDFRQYFLDMNGELWQLVPGQIAVAAKGEPMFATGHTVKDKAGKDRELYEGDIVDWNTSSEKSVYYLVKYDNREAAFMMHMHCVDTVSGVYCTVAQACKGFRGPADPKPILIGNRFENPELMEGPTVDIEDVSNEKEERTPEEKIDLLEVFLRTYKTGEEILEAIGDPEEDVKKL